MRIGWGKLFSYLSRKPGTYAAIGIEYGVNGIHLCAFKLIDGVATWVASQAFPANNWQPELQEFVDSEQMANSHCVISFSPKNINLSKLSGHQYQMKKLGKRLHGQSKS